jgi:hypothetical protein
MRRAGMTLVELLVAVAILITVTASTMLVFRGITKAWQSGQLRTERYQQARLLFDLFVRELSSSVQSGKYPFIGHDAAGEERLRPDGQFDEVFFIGTLPGRPGLVERGYWVTREGEMMCHDHEPADGDYAATGADELCGTDVAEFDATYYDGSQWLTAWDGGPGGAQAGALPKAVRIVLRIGRQTPERFETLINVPTG